MTQTFTVQNYAEKLKRQAERLLPAAGYKEMVSEEMHQKELELLKSTLHYEKFIFVHNNHKFKIEHIHGLKHLLNYKEEDFTIKRFLSIIHPSHLFAHAIISYELLEDFMKGKWPVKFMGFRIINTIALKHFNGQYYLFKSLSWPFQYDEKQRVLSLLHEFTLVGPYNNEPYNARVNDLYGGLPEWYREAVGRSKLAFKTQTPFSPQEMHVLAASANNASTTSAEIAKLFHLKESTIITYKKRILNKAEKLFGLRFKTAKEVAIHLREYGLI